MGLPDHGLFDWVDQLLQENPRRGELPQGFFPVRDRQVPVVCFHDSFLCQPPRTGLKFRP